MGMSTKDMTSQDSFQPVIRLEIREGDVETDNRTEVQRWTWSMAGWVAERLMRAHASAMSEAMELGAAVGEIADGQSVVVLPPGSEEEPS